MAEWLLAHGADLKDVWPETEARNTRENLLYSQTVQEQAGRPGPALAKLPNLATDFAGRMGSARGVSESVPVGVDDELNAVSTSQLHQQVGHVGLHSRLPDE